MTPSRIAKLKELSQGTVRRPTARVAITWAGKGVENARIDSAQSLNRISHPNQVIEGLGAIRKWAFVDTGSTVSMARLDDDLCVMPETETNSYMVGWWGASLSDANGAYSGEEKIKIGFAAQPIGNVTVRGYLDDSNASREYPIDFTIRVYGTSDTVIGTKTVTGNTLVRCQVTLDQMYPEATAVELQIDRWSHSAAFVKITSLFDEFAKTYSEDDIMTLSLLEEADGDSGTLPIGNVTVNQLDLSLQNLDDDYFVGNYNSSVGNMTRANRRVEPYIGFWDGDGDEEVLAPKGVYWTSDWNVSDDSSSASTSAHDRLGLLQDIEYKGVGDIDDDTAAEDTYWENQNLKKITEDILSDLRDRWMPDLIWQIDDSLKDIVVPLAFFKRQSYFSLLREIAVVSLNCVFMDTPTEQEIQDADAVGIRCADVLRIRKIGVLVDGYDELDDVIEWITKDDYITKSVNTRKDDIINEVSVLWQEYEIDDEGKVRAVDDGGGSVTLRDTASQFEYGVIARELPESTLIQTRTFAEVLAAQVLEYCSGARSTCEMSLFGDVTTRVTDVWLLPQYEKRDVVSLATYAVSRLSTEYDGAIRQNATLRRITDKENYVVVERGDAGLDINENSDNAITVNERGY